MAQSLTNNTATPIGLYSTSAQHIVVGAMGGTAIIDPDATSAQIIGVLSAAGAMAAITSAAPANVSEPSISGTPQVGAVLTCDDGEWSGSPAPTITRQWEADGEPIAGATGKTRTLQEEQLGAEITVTVTATNNAGSSSATSAAVGPVTEAD